MEELNKKLTQLYNEIDNFKWGMRDYFEDLEDSAQELSEQITELNESGIRDVEDFIKRLKLEGLYTYELGEFIEKYIKFQN